MANSPAICRSLSLSRSLSLYNCYKRVSLFTETGRWQNIKRENRLCKNCNLNKIETETHFLLECHNYIEGRNYMHNFIKEKMDLTYDLSCSSQVQKLKYIFTFGELSSLNSIGKYIFENFKSIDKQS